MTSEVCLMNSLSVVLAADSATTVQYYGANGPETRYFKGANKIFQLSNHHPVGVMIYNGASLLGVPWEVSIKEFRKELGSKSFNSVEGFSDEFISWINHNIQFYPEIERKRNFVSETTGLIIKDFLSVAKEYDPENGVNVAKRLKDISTLNDPADDLHLISPEAVTDLISSYKADIFETLKSFSDLLPVSLDDALWNDLCSPYSRRTLKHQHTSHSYTGLVFAGFGDHSVFPELVTYGQCRMVGRDFIASEKKADKISFDRPAIIEGFAQTSMVDTFDVGISFEVFVKINEIYGARVQKFIDDLALVNPSLDKDSLENQLASQFKEARDEIFSFTRQEHSTPLRRVLGALPVDEMAELAETLINLQSLKEKVTKPSETVGGPVDVAAITRGEGLVWIKRKHFFPSDINSRFFDRKKSAEGGKL
jgi:hypothetical protein